jgi:hypothetical protein
MQQLCSPQWQFLAPGVTPAQRTLLTVFTHIDFTSLRYIMYPSSYNIFGIAKASFWCAVAGIYTTLHKRQCISTIHINSRANTSTNMNMSFVVLTLYRSASDDIRTIILLMHSFRFGTNNRNKTDKLRFTVADKITYELLPICMHWFFQHSWRHHPVFFVYIAQ